MSYRNPEHAAMQSVDGQTRADDIKATTEVLLGRHEHAAEQLRRVAIDPKDFEDLYSPEGVAKDLRYVEHRKDQFRESDTFYDNKSGLTSLETRQLAEVAEYNVLRGLNVHQWLPACRGRKTSEYDDIYNGIDIVLEYNDKNMSNHLGLAVDITYSQNLSEKFDRVKREIDAFDGTDNRMGVVKYFQSPSSGFRGELSGLPRVVTALDTGVLQDLAKSSSAETHISRHIVVAEMLKQLTVYDTYAAARNPAAQPSISRAHRLLSFIDDVLHSRQTIEDSEYVKNRRMDTEIADNLRKFRV